MCLCACERIYIHMYIYAYGEETIHVYCLLSTEYWTSSLCEIMHLHSVFGCHRRDGKHDSGCVNSFPVRQSSTCRGKNRNRNRNRKRREVSGLDEKYHQL